MVCFFRLPFIFVLLLCDSDVPTEIESDFVVINVFMDTTPLSLELRQYLELYLEAVFECPIQRRNADGTTTLISHEDVCL